MQCSPYYSSVTILLHFFITQYLLKQKLKEWRKGYAHWQCNKQLQNQFTFRHSNIVSKAGCFRNKRSHLTHGFRGSKSTAPPPAGFWWDTHSQWYHSGDSTSKRGLLSPAMKPKTGNTPVFFHKDTPEKTNEAPHRIASGLPRLTLCDLLTS